MYIQVFIKRKESRMTQEEVAKKLGISTDGYRKKEKGYNDFNMTEAKKLAKLFNSSLNELFEGDFNESA